MNDPRIMQIKPSPDSQIIFFQSELPDNRGKFEKFLDWCLFKDPPEKRYIYSVRVVLNLPVPGSLCAGDYIRTISGHILRVMYSLPLSEDNTAVAESIGFPTKDLKGSFELGDSVELIARSYPE